MGINTRCRETCLFALLVFAGFPSGTGAQRRDEFDQRVLSSGYIFSGTVVKDGSQATSQRGRREILLSIRVDRVIEIPSDIRLRTGDRVRLLPTQGNIKAGKQAVFFAQTLELGKDIVLKEVMRASTASLADLPRQVAEAHTRIAQRQLMARIETSSLIVAGEVIAVKKSEDVPQALTEHDPEWRDATIRIQEVLKGDSSLKAVMVRFAASTDVAWAYAPKLREGQTAIWLLHHLPARAKIRLPEGTFSALEPLDVQPASDLENIRKLIR